MRGIFTNPNPPSGKNNVSYYITGYLSQISFISHLKILAVVAYTMQCSHQSHDLKQNTRNTFVDKFL